MSEKRMTVDVKLLTYNFRFRQLTWREESALDGSSKNIVRLMLAAALEEVSGIKVKTPAEATKVIAALPLPVANRVFRIYRGLLPKNRKFQTGNLYRAPEPSVYVKRVHRSLQVIEKATDTVMRKMEQDFGKKEVEEAAEIDRQIVKGSKLRGAVRVKNE